MSDDRGSLGTNILLFLLGAAAGAVVVALTTPKNGPDLRADIKELSRRLKVRAKEAGKVLRSGCGDEAAAAPEEEQEHGEVGL
jgi:gas vesicle protein